MAKRVTTNNARHGKNGVFLAKHLDGKDGKAAKMGGLRYTWHCDPDKKKDFEQVEADFYEKHFRASLDAQNERHIKARQKKRVRTMDQYREAKNTCPECTLFYLGNKEDNAGTSALQSVVVEFWKWRQVTFPLVKSLDLALHVEDGAPHIHERHVWIGHDKDGNEIVNQEAALAEMGVLPPDPSKPVSRKNNAKMTFTEQCREKMQELARAHGIEITTEPREAGEAGLSQAKYKTQDEQRKQREAEAKRLEAEQAAEKARAELQKNHDAARMVLQDIKAMEKIAGDKQKDVELWIRTEQNEQRRVAELQREIGDMTEYRAWKADKAAKEAQEAARRKQEEDEAKRAAEAARKAQEAQKQKEREEQARKAAEAAQRAARPKTQEEMYQEARAAMFGGSASPEPPRSKAPSILDGLRRRTEKATDGKQSGWDGPDGP